MSYMISHDDTYDTVELKTAQGKVLLLDKQQARQLAFDLLQVTNNGNLPNYTQEKDWRP